MQTRKQEYASSAFDQVNALKTSSEKEKDPRAYRTRYGSMAHKLPVLIRTAGLAQALEFVQSRGKDEHKKLLEHLEETVLPDRTQGKSLLKRSREAKLGEYTRLTRDCLGALLWYKRFAESVLGVKLGDEDATAGGDIEQ
jgi:CRISPR-associated protein Cmr5